MIGVALRGLAARPLRTVLTAVAIVLGVGLVTAALSLTDTMCAAATSLSASAYDGTDAVVGARLAYVTGTESWTERPTIPASSLDAVRRVPGVRTPVGDITDSAQIIGRDGKPVGDGAYFAVGFDARTPGRPDAVPAHGRRVGRRPRRGRARPGTAKDQNLHVGERVEIAVRGGAREFRVAGLAMFGSVSSLGTATAGIFDLHVAQSLFEKRGRYDDVLVAGHGARAALAHALPASLQVQTAREHDRFDLEGLDTFIGILRIVLVAFGCIAVLVGAFTILNSLSITVAQRSRELGLLRMIGATRRQVLRSVLVEALVLGLGASLVGVGAGHALARALDGVFGSLGSSCRTPAPCSRRGRSSSRCSSGRSRRCSPGSCRRSAPRGSRR